MEQDVGYLNYLRMRETMRERQAEGIAAAQARGVRFGRPSINPPKNFVVLVKRWERGKLKFHDLLGQIGLKEATFYRRLREYRTGKQDLGF